MRHTPGCATRSVPLRPSSRSSFALLRLLTPLDVPLGRLFRNLQLSLGEDFENLTRALRLLTFSSSRQVHGFTVPVVKLSTQARVLTRTWSVQSSGVSSTVDIREHTRAALDSVPIGPTAAPTATTIRFAEETASPPSSDASSPAGDNEVAKPKQTKTPPVAVPARLEKGERAYVEGKQVVIESSAGGSEARRVVSREAFEKANGADMVDRS